MVTDTASQTKARSKALKFLLLISCCLFDCKLCGLGGTAQKQQCYLWYTYCSTHDQYLLASTWRALRVFACRIMLSLAHQCAVLCCIADAGLLGSDLQRCSLCTG